jgi:hypothetical protein
MSALRFDRVAELISLTRQDGSQVGSWPAANNVASGSKPFPDGQWAFAYHKDHPEDPGPDSAYGSYGIFIFTVPGRTGLGVHSGRASVPDGLGRVGPEHATNGCIRTTDDATLAILTLTATDALTTLTVEEAAAGVVSLIRKKRASKGRKRAQRVVRKKASRAVAASSKKPAAKKKTAKKKARVAVKPKASRRRTK